MIERLSNRQGVKKSQTTAGQRELLREYRNKTNELVDAVNHLNQVVCGGPDDDDEYDCECTGYEDLCPECRAFFEPDCPDYDDDDDLCDGCRAERDDECGCPDHTPCGPTLDLSEFTTSKLENLRDEVEYELGCRPQEADESETDSPYHRCATCDTKMTGEAVFCPACQEIHDTVEEVRADHHRRKTAKDNAGLATVDTKDGLLQDFIKYVSNGTDLRFWQCLTVWSGYSKLIGEKADGTQVDLFYKTDRGPRQ